MSTTYDLRHLRRIQAVFGSRPRTAKGSKDIFITLTVAFFLLTFVLKALTDGIFVTLGQKGAITDSKYLTMGGAIFFGICYMGRSHKFGMFWREFKQLVIVVLAFVLVTCGLVLYRGEFDSWQVRDILNLLTPMLFAYVVLNTIPFEALHKCMKVVLVSSFIGYIIQLLLRGVTWADIWASSFDNSTSVLESNDFSALAIMLCFYFCYYRKDMSCTILSVVFAVATFKRLAIIFAIVILVLPKIVDPNRHLPKRSGLFFKILFFALAMGYMYLLWPTTAAVRVFGQDLDEMTMGRADFLRVLIDSGFQSFGYGSVEATLGYSLEMCFIRISLELSPLATLLFINNYWNLTRGNFYCVLLIVFQFLNLTTADSISAMFAWAVAYILIGSIHYRYQLANAMNIDGVIYVPSRSR